MSFDETIRFVQTNRLAEPCAASPAAAYYFRQGSGSGADRWIIRFQGGAWCTDMSSCQMRMSQSPWLMSSKLFPVGATADALLMMCI